MKNNTFKRNNSGFTLIELMVTIAIVGIFASIALPSFSQLIENNRISTATNELVTNLMLTRSEALKRSNNVTICASTNQTSCSGSTDYSAGWIVFLDCDSNGTITTAAIDCDNDGAADDSETIIKVGDGFNKIYMNNNVSSSITYTFSGRSATSTFSVGKDVSNLKKKISVNRVGRIRTEDY